MSDNKKAELAKKAGELINTITAKNLNQTEVSKLTGISTTALSKLKSVEYFPGNGAAMVGELERLVEALNSDPKHAVKSLYDGENKNRKIRFWLYYLIPLFAGFAIGTCFFKKEKVVKEKTSIEAAFRILFESDMQAAPYSEKTQLPCYQYQEKWELDDNSPYTIVLQLNRGTYYYRSKSIHLYAWCEIGNDKGNRLDALELFTNELWLDTKNRTGEIESLRNADFESDEGFLKLAEVSSIFSDTIGFGYNAEKKLEEPNAREGKRIARYFKPFVTPGYEKQVEDVINNYISKLSKTACHEVKVFGNDDTSEELVLQFDCIFFKEDSTRMAEQRYSKRIKKPKGFH